MGDGNDTHGRSLPPDGPVNVAPATAFDGLQGLGGRITSEPEFRAAALMERLANSGIMAIHTASAGMTADAARRDEELMRKLTTQISDTIYAVGDRLAKESAARDAEKAEELQQFETLLAAEVEAIQRRQDEAMATRQKTFDEELKRRMDTAESAIAERNRALTVASNTDIAIADLARRFAEYTERTEERMATLYSRAEAAEAMVTRIRASMSWRITKPFRLVGRTMHRASRALSRPSAKAPAANGDDKPRPGVLSRLFLPVARFFWQPVRSILDRFAAFMWPRRRRFNHVQRPTVLPGAEIPAGQWLTEFERLNKRKLRVLHIGNIANNAYNNAKIQRRHGIEADVLCNDYYHIMACPEWEDARFTGKVGDDMFPDWWAAKLKNYKRPRWFVQGPWDACIRYLLAYTAKAPARHFLWRWLTFERWMVCRNSPMRDRIRAYVFRKTNRMLRYDAGPSNGILWKWWGRYLEEWAEKHKVRWRRISERARNTGLMLTALGTTADTGEAQVRNLHFNQHLRKTTRERMGALLGDISLAPGMEFAFNWWWHPYIMKMFRRYDLVQAYSTYTAMPFIVNVPYLAYEHGTIRTLPFEESEEGRMCLATYRAAETVLVTNTDNLVAAERMGIEPSRTVALPHAFDSDKLARFADRFRRPARPTIPMFIMSARQHWVDRALGWSKANDLVYRAMAIVKASGRTCRLRAVAWGKDVEASKQLIKDLGIEEMVEWVPPMRKDELWRAYMSSAAVIDQFDMRALGGVTFEAMMLGCRTISNIDPVETGRFFGEPPPLHNCSTAEEIAAAFIDVIDDPADAGGRGRRNRDWMQKYHSAERIVSLQRDAYRVILDQYSARKQDAAA